MNKEYQKPTLEIMELELNDALLNATETEDCNAFDAKDRVICS